MGLTHIEDLAIRSLETGVAFNTVVAACGITRALFDAAAENGWTHAHNVPTMAMDAKSLYWLGYIGRGDVFGRDYVFRVPVDTVMSFAVPQSNEDADKHRLRGVYKYTPDVLTPTQRHWADAITKSLKRS